MDPPHHIFVRSAGLVADGFESQNGTDAFDDRLPSICHRL
jgi:hypothetical protein